jgi:hypothetical protein
MVIYKDLLEAHKDGWLLVGVIGLYATAGTPMWGNPKNDRIICHYAIARKCRCDWR